MDKSDIKNFKDLKKGDILYFMTSFNAYNIDALRIYGIAKLPWGCIFSGQCLNKDRQMNYYVNAVYYNESATPYATTNPKDIKRWFYKNLFERNTLRRRK